MSDDSVDKTVIDLRDMFNRMQIPCVIVYQKTDEKDQVATFLRYSADMDQLLTMASTCVSALTQRIMHNWKLDQAAAHDMALKAVVDTIKNSQNAEQIIEDET